MDAREQIATLTDEELRTAINEASDDLKKASKDEPESEWHEACFAAVILFSQEMSRRGLFNRKIQ